MRNTTNYNLKLPDGPDKYNVQDFNSNAEKIDAELKSHSDAIADRYSKTEVDNKFSMHEMNVDWKESVDTFDDIAITYPNPESGWTVNAKDTNYTYRYDGTSWVAISANAIPKATKELDGIMGKEMVTELERVGQKIDDVKKEEHYTVKEFYTFPENINEITYGNGKYVAVCENNIYTSTDKIKWDITFNTGAKSVAYGNGFIAVGQNGLILTSQNGIDWIDRTDDAMANLSKVIYAGGKFIIVGEGGIIATSDGSAVTKQTSPTDTDLKAVTYGNGKYIAVGNLRGYASVVTSEDGVTWTKITLNALLNRKAIFDIAYGNGNYIILDSTTLYVTGDFTNVIAKRLDDVPTANGVISYIKDRFILSCRYKVYDSKDGIEWIEITKELDCKLSNIDYINSEIIGISTLKKVIKLDTYSMEELKNNVSELNSALYPVGIVLAFVNGFDPNKSLLGEWEPIAKGQTLVGVNESDPDFNSVEKSGGLKDVTLSIKQIPVHSHQESDLSYVYTDEHPANNSIVTTNQNGRQNINMNIKSKTYTKNAGEGGAHSNLQPYITVFYWVRRK